ncbi:MAG: GNAT family N-acetyltransferase [Bosea sp.]|nr:GNAT family N-acetyltransferase [Bosea sp. (in: a-proteobacteria)]
MTTPPTGGAALPLGDLVDPVPAATPARTVLEGTSVSIVPFDVEEHSAALFEATATHDDLWAYMGQGPFGDLASFVDYYAVAAEKTDPLLFTILERESGRPLGHATYLRIAPNDRVIEVGNILYTPALQRTRGATEAMYLMARHAFEDLGYRRYEWKCNALNAPSRRAALRLGFTYEGTFRQHMIVKGRNRDTAWFAMLDSEWPSIKAAFEAWLSPDNFAEDGSQRFDLATIREGLGGA